jgi:hypothetical protein
MTDEAADAATAGTNARRAVVERSRPRGVVSLARWVESKPDRARAQRVTNTREAARSPSSTSVSQQTPGVAFSGRHEIS